MAVTDDTDWLDPTDEVRRLALEYAEAMRRCEGEWVFVQQPRDGELQYETFSYVPEYHFRQAYDQLMQQSFKPDGGYDTLHEGTRRATVYYWLNPKTGASLYHTGVNDEEIIPFFPDETAARGYLEKRADTGNSDLYGALSLYKARTRKIADATDVLTDQADIADYLADDEG